MYSGAGVVLLCILLAAACSIDHESASDPAIDPISHLSAEAPEDFLRALDVREFRFPRDHGPHPGYRNEWWYLTGNLKALKGPQRFGFQSTFFRIGLTATPPARPSSWAARDLWMAHFAITDPSNRRFHAFERFARGAQGLAGASNDPPRIWLEDWTLQQTPDQEGRWRLSMGTTKTALDLELRPLREPVLHGDHGLSRKSDRPGNASYYYSVTRMGARGELRLGDKVFQVGGTAWLDREWGSSALAPEQTGWDWFSLQMDDGSDIMYYRLRNAGEKTDRHSKGTLLRPSGEQVSLHPGNLTLVSSEYWRSPAGTRYPVRWLLSVEPLGTTFLLRPLLDGQELDLSVRYWEGAIEVLDSSGEGPVLGRGYMELTGYAKTGH